MNKIYKIVWNAVRNCYVVASEFASGKESLGVFRSTFVSQMTRYVLQSTLVVLACLLTLGFVPDMNEHVYAADTNTTGYNSGSTYAHNYVARGAGGTLRGAGVDASHIKTQHIYIDDKDNIILNSDNSFWDGSGTVPNKYYNTQGSIQTYTSANQPVQGQNVYGYTWDATNNHWVRDGYKLTVLSNNSPRTGLNARFYNLGATETLMDAVWTGTGTQPTDILYTTTSVTSDIPKITGSTTPLATNLNETLQQVTANNYGAMSNSGTDVGKGWGYIIYDPTGYGTSLANTTDRRDGKNWPLASDGYADVGEGKGTDGFPRGFKRAGMNEGLAWDATQQRYVYTNPTTGLATPVNNSNIYVLSGTIGVFTNEDGSLYTGNVYGGNNTLLMTTTVAGKDANGNTTHTFYSYWGDTVSDSATTMANYPVSSYNSDIQTLVNNDTKLAHNDIHHVKVAEGTDRTSVNFQMYRNGANMNGDETDANRVTGSNISIRATGGTGGIASNVGGNDRGFTISADGRDIHTFNMGSRVGVQSDLNGNSLESLTINGHKYDLQRVYVGDDGTQVVRNLSRPLNLVGGVGQTGTGNLLTSQNNIGVTKVNDETMRISLNKDINLSNTGSLTVGNTLVNNNGVTVTSAGGNPSITASGVDAGNKQMTNVASGTQNSLWTSANAPVSGNTTDAANWNHAANIGDVYSLISSQSNISAGNNITVTPNTSNGVSAYTVSLKDHVTLGVNSANPVDINGEGLNASIRLGSDNSTKKITLDGAKGQGTIADAKLGEFTADDNLTSTKYTSSTYGEAVGTGDAARQSVTTTVNRTGSTGTQQTGTYITGLDNKDWNWRNLEVVSGRAATEDQVLKAGQHFFSINPRTENTDLTAIPNYYNDGASGAASLAIGHGVSTATSATGSIAIGSNGTTTGKTTTANGTTTAAGGQFALAVGNGAKAEGNQSMALGYDADAAGDYSVSIGNRNYANGIRSISLGVDVQSGFYSPAATVESDDYESGKMRGGADISIGNKSRVYGSGSTAIGFGAKVGVPSEATEGQMQNFTAETDLAVALGGRSLATQDGSVALGNMSYANRGSGSKVGNDTPYLKPDNVNLEDDMGTLRAQYNEDGSIKEEGSTSNLKAGTAWQANMGAVSIGAEERTGTLTDQNGTVTHIYKMPTITRQLTGLAAGTEDTDAVNVAQLKALSEKGLNFQGNDENTVHTNAGDTLKVQGTDSNIRVTGNPADKSLQVALNQEVNVTTLNAGKEGTADSGTAGTVNIVGKNSNGDYKKASVTAEEGKDIANNNTQRLQYKEDTTPAGATPSTSKTHTVATLEDDGIKVAGDTGDEASNPANVKLNKQVNVTGGATDTTDEKNIGVKATTDDNGNATLSVQLAKDVKGLNSVSAGTDAKMGNNEAGTLQLKDKSGADQSGQYAAKGDYVTGLDNKDWNVDNPTYVSGRAATEDELRTVSNQVSTNKTNIADHETRIQKVEQGWNLKANGETDSANIQAGDTVTLNTVADKNSGDNAKNNLSVSRTDKTVSFSLNKDVTLGTTNGTETGGSLTVNGSKANTGDTSNRSVSIDGTAVNVIKDNTTQAKLSSSEYGGYLELGGGNLPSTTTAGGTLRLYRSEDTDATGIPRLAYTTVGDDGKFGTRNTLATLTDGISISAGTTTDANNQAAMSNKVALNKNVKVDGDENITTAATADANGDATVSLKLKNELSDINSISGNGSKIEWTNNGVKLDAMKGTDNAVTSHVDVDDQQIKNVAAGTEGTDAVNLNQLNNAAGGWDVQTNGTALKTVSTTKAAGDNDTTGKSNRTLNFVDGTNMSITGSGNDITIATKPDVTFNSITAGSTAATGGGIKIANQKTITGDSSNGDTGNFITGLNNLNFNVNNTAFEKSDRAATESQLYQAVKDINEGVVQNDKYTTGGSVSYETNGAGTGTLSMSVGSTVTLNGLKNNYISSATVNNGVVSLYRNDDTDKKNPITIDLSNLKTTDTRIGGAAVTTGQTTTYTGEYNIDGTGKLELNVINADGTPTNQKIIINGLAWKTTVDKGMNFGANDNSANQVNNTATAKNRQLGDTQNIKGRALTTGETVNNTTSGDKTFSTKNATTRLDANGDIEIDLADNPELQSIILNGANNTNVTLKAGDDNRLSYSVTNGNTTSTHQVANLDDGMSYTGDNSTETDGVQTNVLTKKLNEKVNLRGGATAANLSDNNIGVTVDTTNDQINVKLAKDLTGLNTVTVGRDSASNNTTGVVIGYQEDKASIKTTTGTGESATTTYSQQGNYVTGLDNRTWDPKKDPVEGGRAATEDQLRALESQVTDAYNTSGSGTSATRTDNPYGGFGLTGDNTTDENGTRAVVKQDIGKTIAVKGGANIGTVATDYEYDGEVDKSLTINLDKNLVDMSSATFDRPMATTGTINGTTVINANGVTVTPTGKSGNDVISLGTGGLSNGNNQIKYVASGVGITATDKDADAMNKIRTATGDTLTNAVNVGDLQATLKAASDSVGLKFQGNTDGVTIALGNESTLKIQGGGDATLKGYEENPNKGWGNENVRVEADDKNNTLTINTAKDFHVDTLRAGTDGDNNNTQREGHVKIAGRTSNNSTFHYTDITTGYVGADSNAALRPATDTNTDTNHGIDRLSYQNVDTDGKAIAGTQHVVATLDDGLTVKADNGDAAGIGLNHSISLNGGASASDLVDAANKNIGTTITKDEDGNATISLQLNKDLTGLNTVTAGSVKIGNQTVSYPVPGTTSNMSTESGDYVSGLTNQKWTVAKDASGHISGGSITSNGGYAIVSGRAATEDQLLNLQNGLANLIELHESSTYGLTADDGKTVAKTLGQNIDVKGSGAVDVNGNTATLTDAEGKTQNVQNIKTAVKQKKNADGTDANDSQLELSLSDHIALNTSEAQTGSSLTLNGKQRTYQTEGGTLKSHNIVELNPDDANAGISLVHTNNDGTISKDGVRIIGPQDYYTEADEQGNRTRITSRDSNGSVGITNATGDFTARIADRGGTGYLGLGNTVSTSDKSQIMNYNQQLTKGTAYTLDEMDAASLDGNNTKRDSAGYGLAAGAVDANGNMLYMKADGTVTTDIAEAATRKGHVYYQDNSGKWVVAQEDGKDIVTDVPIVAKKSELWTDENGKPVYVVDGNGNVVYQNNADGTKTPLQQRTAGAMVSAKYGTASLNAAANADGSIEGRKDGAMTRLQYLDEGHFNPETGEYDTNVIHEVATLDDGLKVSGTTGASSNALLNKTLQFNGDSATDGPLSTGTDRLAVNSSNIGVRVSQDTNDATQTDVWLNLNRDLKGFSTIQVGGRDIDAESYEQNGSGRNQSTIVIGNQSNPEETKDVDVTAANYSNLRYVGKDGTRTGGLYEAKVGDITYYTTDEKDSNLVKKYAKRIVRRNGTTTVTWTRNIDEVPKAYKNADGSVKDSYARTIQLTDDLSTQKLTGDAKIYQAQVKDGDVTHVYYTTDVNDANIMTNPDGSKVTLKTSLNAENGRYMTGLSNTKWDNGLHFDSDRAATENQLKTAEQNVSSYRAYDQATQTGGGFALADDSGKNVTQNLGTAIAIKGDSTVDESGAVTKQGNILTTADDNGKSIKVSLNRNLDVDSVKTGDTKIDTNGIAITNPTDSTKNISLTKDGLNNGGNKITNVANGVDDHDAVNMSQLKNVETTAGQHTEVTVNGDNVAPADGTYTTDGNLRLKKTKAADGKDVFDVKLADDVNVKTVTTGDETNNAKLDANGLVITDKSGGTDKKVEITSSKVDFGGNKIQNIASGETGKVWDSSNANYNNWTKEQQANANNAANMGDVYSIAKSEAAKAANTVSGSDNITVTPSGKQPNDYKVSLNNDVTLGKTGEAGKLALTDAKGTKTIDVNGAESKVTVGTGDNAINLDGKTGVIRTGDVQMSKDGIKAGDKQITNVASGLVDKNGKAVDLQNAKGDTLKNAANIGDLQKATSEINNNITEVNNTVAKGLNFQGDDKADVNRKLGDTLKLNGGQTDKDKLIQDEKNIGIVRNDAGDGLDVRLAKDIKGLDSLSVKDTKIDDKGVTVTKNMTDDKGNSTGTMTTVINGSGMTITKPVLDKDGQPTKDKDGKPVYTAVAVTDNNVTMGGNQVQNIASGMTGQTYEGKNGIYQQNKDGSVTNIANNAASIGDLNTVANNITNNTNTQINRMNGAINKLGNRIDKVGAGAAALAGLHPQDFDPEDKWDIAAGYGHYRSANAMAVGAFYRPDEYTMFSVGGSFGGGENLVNAGLTIKLGKREKDGLVLSRVAMAEQIRDLKATIEMQNAKIAKSDELEAKVAKQDQEIAELKAMVKALAAKQDKA